MQTLRKKSPKRFNQNNAPLTEDKALSYGLRLLKTRPRSCFEVAMRLKERGLEGYVIDSVLQQLTALKLLDDARFARDWVRWRDRTRASGARMLRFELSDKGIDDALISAVLAERETPDWREDIGVPQDVATDESLAADLVARRAPRMKDLEPDKRQRRLLDLLLRRGFSYGIAYKAVKKNGHPQSS